MGLLLKKSVPGSEHLNEKFGSPGVIAWGGEMVAVQTDSCIIDPGLWPR